jgi:selenide,water dikinase
MKVADNLRTLNYKASLIARESNASACTDVTGFGLMGHMREMSAGNVTMEIDFAKVPYFIEAIEMVTKGMIPGGSRANHEYNKPYVYLDSSIEYEQEMVLFDAQTSGGLLVSVPQTHAQQMVDKCTDAGLTAAIIGDVVPYDGYDIVVKYTN